MFNIHIYEQRKCQEVFLFCLSASQGHVDVLVPPCSQPLLLCYTTVSQRGDNFIVGLHAYELPADPDLTKRTLVASKVTTLTSN